MSETKEFGSCCKDLRDAIFEPPSSFFATNENGVFYLTTGYVQTEQGTGWFDQAVLFCPFCGAPVQSKDEILRKAHKDA